MLHEIMDVSQSSDVIDTSKGELTFSSLVRVSKLLVIIHGI
jgi:hypothetical protein